MEKGDIGPSCVDGRELAIFDGGQACRIAECWPIACMYVLCTVFLEAGPWGTDRWRLGRWQAGVEPRRSERDEANQTSY
jgi:hypothetical protein